MKKILWVFVLLFIGCAPTLSQQKQFTFEDGARLFTLTVDQKEIKSEANDFLYKNDDFQISMQINSRAVKFVYVNTSKALQRFIWEESAIVAPDGTASRLGNANVTWAGRNNPIAASLIPSNSKFNDVAFPMDNLNFTDRLILNDMFTFPIKTVTNIRLLLSLEVNAQKIQKEFVFTANPTLEIPVRN